MMPCFSVGAASMRQPSTTTSCVAEPKATTKVNAAVAAMLHAGSLRPTPTSPSATIAWQAIIHARRRPTRRARIGTSKASMSGDQRNFRL